MKNTHVQFSLKKWAPFLAGICCGLILMVSCSSFGIPLSIGEGMQAASAHLKNIPALPEATATLEAPNTTLTPAVTVTPSPTATMNEPVKSAGCGRTAVIYNGITVELTISVDALQSGGATSRTYRLHVPANYQSNQPLPLLLAFHGRGSNAKEIEDYSTFSQLAEKESFIAVYLQGLRNQQQETFWNTSGSSSESVNELHFVNRVLDELQTRYCLDTRRIYATGFSNGANMVGLLACKLADRITAIAPFGGYYFDYQDGCKPARPVPIINGHATADTVVPYDSAPSNENTDIFSNESQVTSQPGIQVWLREWAIRDGCAEGPTPFLQTPAFRGEQWTACYNRTSIVHYRIEGGEHLWPPKLGEVPTAEVVWKFMKEHLLPCTT